jgi:hypothetical protein
MRTSWFFATTPVPRPALPEPRAAAAAVIRRWWRRAGERLVVWGEGARRHRMGSWTEREWPAAYNGGDPTRATR